MVLCIDQTNEEAGASTSRRRRNPGIAIISAEDVWLASRMENRAGKPVKRGEQQT